MAARTVHNTRITNPDTANGATLGGGAVSGGGARPPSTTPSGIANPDTANGATAQGGSGTAQTTVPTASVTTAATPTWQNTAQGIIQYALSTVGFNPTDAASLTSYYWGQVQADGLTNSTDIQNLVTDTLPSRPEFVKAFPGYADAIKNGYVRTIGEYVTAEEGITATLISSGISKLYDPKEIPTVIGNMIAGGLSASEVANRITNGYEAVQNAPAEVQNYFSQEFGSQGGTALAAVFLNPGIDTPTLSKMLAGAQVRGAASAANLTVSQGLSQRLADMGQTYSSAQAKFQAITNQAGLFQQTVGEQSSQQGDAGTQNGNTPLTASNQGVSAAFGLDSNAVQQVHQASLARENEFRGTGGASSTQAEGYSGLAQAKSS